MQLTTSLPLKYYRFAISAIFFLAGLSFSSWASRIPDIKAALDLNEVELGLVLFALPIGQIVSLPISAWLISRFGSKAVSIAAGFLYPLVLVMLSIASTKLMLSLGLVGFGFFANMLNIAMNTQAVGLEKFYGKSIMASFHGLWSLGGFTGAILGGVFVSSGIDPLPHFTFVFFISCLILWAGNKYTLTEDVRSESKTSLFTKPDKSILILGVIAFCCMVCEGAMADWSGVYFQRVVRVPEQLITMGYIAFTSTMATGRFVSDGLVNRFGVKKVLSLSGIFITAGLALAVSIPTLLMATLGFFLVGFGVSSVVPIAYGLAGKSNTMAPSTALAAVSSISFLGFLIGPPMIGFIAHQYSLQFSFALIALLGLGSTLFAGKVKVNDS